VAISYAMAAIFLVVCHFSTRRAKSIALVEAPQEVLQ